MYSHRVNSPKNLAKYSGNTSSKIFPVFARVRIQAPHVFSQKNNSPRTFSCMYWFCAGGYYRTMIYPKNLFGLFCYLLPCKAKITLQAKNNLRNVQFRIVLKDIFGGSLKKKPCKIETTCKAKSNLKRFSGHYRGAPCADRELQTLFLSRQGPQRSKYGGRSRNYGVVIRYFRCRRSIFSTEGSFGCGKTYPKHHLQLFYAL